MRSISVMMVKIGIFLYGVFALFLILAGNQQWFLAKTPETPPKESLPVNKEVILDLTKEKDYLVQQKWHSFLDQYVANQDIKRETQVRVFQKYYGKILIKHLFLEDKVYLPTTLKNTQFEELANQLKKMLETAGLEVNQLNWGYTNKQGLWLKVGGHKKLTVDQKDLPINLELLKITVIKEVRQEEHQVSFKGILPAKLTPLPASPQSFQDGNIKGVTETPVPGASKILSASNSKNPKDLNELPEKMVPPLKKEKRSAATPALAPVKKKSLPQSIKGRVAIIIDDIGYQKELAEAFLKLKVPLTWAVLPQTPYGRLYAQKGAAHGFEIMLHQPLEPLDPTIDPGPGLIKREWSASKMSQQLNENLADTPFVRGINNHMGSAGMTHPLLMDVIMQELKRQKLFFIDSNSGPNSVAKIFATKYQVPYACNQVFIDNEPDQLKKRAAIQKLIHIALEDQTAIGIGHVRPGTAEAIAAMLPEFIKQGIEIVPVSQLVKF